MKTSSMQPTLEEALARVGSGAGYGSLVVANGRSRIGHIQCQKVGGALCGADKRKSAHFDTDCDNEDEEFPVWLKLNWELGICRACLRTLHCGISTNLTAPPLNKQEVLRLTNLF